MGTFKANSHLSGLTMLPSTDDRIQATGIFPRSLPLEHLVPSSDFRMFVLKENMQAAVCCRVIYSQWHPPEADEHARHPSGAARRRNRRRHRDLEAVLHLSPCRQDAISIMHFNRASATPALRHSHRPTC